MATFRPTMLAVWPCLVCSAAETEPGSFVSVVGGRTRHTGADLLARLSAVCGAQLPADGAGRLLCRRCLRQLDGHDLTESRLRLVRRQLVRARARRPAAAAITAVTAAPAPPQMGSDKTISCLVCQSVQPLQDSTDIFWERTQFSLSTFAEILDKHLSLTPEPGRAGGCALCRSCATTLNRLDGLTARRERQARLLQAQYWASRGPSEPGHSHGVAAAAGAVPAEPVDQPGSPRPSDDVLESLGLAGSPDCRAPSGGGPGVRLPLHGADDLPDSGDHRHGLDSACPDLALLGSPGTDEPATSPPDDGAAGATGGRGRPSLRCDSAELLGAPSEDPDQPQVGPLDESCDDPDDLASYLLDQKAPTADAAPDLDVSALMAETVYSDAGSPAGSRPPSPAPVRTIYVQLKALDPGDELQRRPADSRPPPPGPARAETVEVVRMGPADRLVPQVRPYRKRSARSAPAAEQQPPVKRGRGRPRKTDPTVVRRHRTLHKTVKYVWVRSLVQPPVMSEGEADTPSADTDQNPGTERTVVPAAELKAAADRQSAGAAEALPPEAALPPEVALPPDVAVPAPPAAGGGSEHQLRLAEAMQRINSHIAETRPTAEGGAGQEAAQKEPDQELTQKEVDGQEESLELAVSGRSLRINGQYLCEVCHDTYAMLRDLLKHEKEHTEEKYPCLMCNKKFALPKLVRKHQKCHKASRTYQCVQCGLKFRSQLSLMEHMHEHTGDDHFCCGTCGKSFASRQCFRTHARTHAARPARLACESCGRPFAQRAALLRHQQARCDPQVPCPQPGCQRRFGSEKWLARHLLQHVGGRPWRCALCQKEFKTKYSLRDHVRGHSGERPFACELCGARFTLRSNLIMHGRYVHQNDRRYECGECGKRFKRRRLLTYHEMAHDGRRPLQCPHCPLQMIYPEHLKQHLRTHSGEKPYHCDVCSKSFSRSDNLKAHMFTHSNKKPFECRQCGLGFMRKMSLVQHMEQMSHGEHPDDYVINRTLVTSENVPTDEVVHTFELVDSKDGHVVMLVRDDSRPEVLVQEGTFVTADADQLDGEPVDVSFLAGDVEYIAADGRQLDLIIDGRPAPDADTVDLVIEPTAVEADDRQLAPADDVEGGAGRAPAA